MAQDGIQTLLALEIDTQESRAATHRLIVLNEAHLCRLVTSFLDYYHTVRPHLSLECNAPIPRPKQVPSDGKVVAMPCVGGLHHGYRRVA